MADYPPPNENLQIFNPAAFSVTDGALTIEDGKKFFLQFPNAQGTENLATTNISGVLTSTLNSHNLGFGYQALQAKIDGSAVDNTAFGFQALAALTLGDSNTAIGDLAFPIMTGTSALTQRNTAVGHQAGRYLLDGLENTFVGYNAGAGTSSHTGSNNNTCIGSIAGSSLTTGDNNVMLGYKSGGQITSGHKNICIGTNACNLVTGGIDNVGIGEESLFLATGSRNTANGSFAGQSLTTGGNNTFIGYYANTSFVTCSNSTAIGSNATITASNQIVLGTTSETIRLNKISPLYTTLPTYTSADIGYTYTPTITPSTLQVDYATQSVSAGVWMVTCFFIYGAAGGASFLSIRDAVSGGGTEYSRGYVTAANNNMLVSSIVSITSASATITFYPSGTSTAGSIVGTFGRFSITRIA